MANEANPAQPRLPVGEIIKESFAFPFAHLPALLRLGWFPAFAFGGASLLIGIITPFGGFRGGAPRIHLGWRLGIGTLIQLAVSVSWSVAWMRLVIGISESEVRLRFGRREWKYAGIFYGLIFGGSLVNLVFIMLLTFGLFYTGVFRSMSRSSLMVAMIVPVLALFVILFALWTRVILVLPAIAMDRYRGLRTHWRETRGNFWRVVIIELVTAIPAFFLWWPLARISRPLHGAILIFAAFVFSIITVALSSFVHTGLALIYRRLAPEPPSPALAQAQAG